MSYVALRFDADADAADAWSDALLDAARSSVDISDPAAGTADETPIYDEPGERRRRAVADRAARRRCFAQRHRCRCARCGAARERSACALPPHEICRRRRAGLGARDAGAVRAARISPTDSGSCRRGASRPIPPRINLALDPGLAFGTGSHPTTRLCLEWLARELRAGESLLDYGCGSGILAIAAAKLGAGRVAGDGHRSAGARAPPRTTRARTASTRVRRARCTAGRGRSTSSSRTSSPIRCIVARAGARAAGAATAGAIVLSGIARRRRRTRSPTAYARVV